MDRQIALIRCRAQRLVLRRCFFLAVPLVMLAAGAGAGQSSSPYAPATQPAPSSAQSPDQTTRKATAKDLEAVRAQLKKGDAAGARATLDGFEPAAETLRLRVVADLALDKVTDAVTDYDRLVGLSGAEEDGLLADVARGVVRHELTAQDPLVALEACATLLGAGTDACARTLDQRAGDSALPFAQRIQSLAVLARHGMAGAADKLRQLAGTAVGGQYRVVVEASESLSVDTAVSLLIAALRVEDAGVQYAAASALGNRPSADARAALEKFESSASPGIARSAARLSLARLGSDQWLKQFVDVLPQLEGDVLLDIGQLLQARGDARGIQAIERVVQGDHEVLRITAAAKLPATSDLVRTTFEAGLASQNPWTRVATLQQFRSSSLLTPTRARAFLLDREPWARVRAAQSILARKPSTRPSSAARHP
jgi:hypothetical protein